MGNVFNRHQRIAEKCRMVAFKNGHEMKLKDYILVGRTLRVVSKKEFYQSLKVTHACGYIKVCPIVCSYTTKAYCKFKIHPQLYSKRVFKKLLGLSKKELQKDLRIDRELKNSGATFGASFFEEE